MIDHIYGRVNLINRNDRPPMFIKELMLYIDYWMELFSEAQSTLDSKKQKYIEEFYKNLLDGISYYRKLTRLVNHEWHFLGDNLYEGLNKAENQLTKSFKSFMRSSFVLG